jgi:DNA-binding MarR family transcriptional regulator
MKIDEAIQTKFDSPLTKAVVNVRFTANYLSSKSNKFMSKYDLTMPQFNILRILRGAKDKVAVNTVKERMVEKSPNTTRLMDKLIDKGLINRERCESDRRVVYIKITKKGLNLLSDIDNNLAIDELLPKNLTEDESNILSDLLDKLRG